jgi:RNA polymerase sigma factor (sigma-70 family)
VPSAPEPEEPWELAVIRREARYFLKRAALRWSDEEDLVQEAWLAWSGQRQRYDIRRGASEQTFLKRVAMNTFRDVRKREAAGQRAGHRLALSLDEAVAPNSDVTLGDMTPGTNDIAALDAGLDLESLLERLTGRQRAIVRMTLEGYRLEEIASGLGVSRDTVHQDRVKLRDLVNRDDLI